MTKKKIFIKEKRESGKGEGGWKWKERKRLESEKAGRERSWGNGILMEEVEIS
jgi:hypothetical protein